MKLEVIKKSIKKTIGQYYPETKTILEKGTETLVFDDVAIAVSHINQVPNIETNAPNYPFCYEAYYKDGMKNKDITLFKVLQYGKKAVIQIELRWKDRPRDIHWLTAEDYKTYLDYSGIGYQDE